MGVLIDKLSRKDDEFMSKRIPYIVDKYLVFQKAYSEELQSHMKSVRERGER